MSQGGSLDASVGVRDFRCISRNSIHSRLRPLSPTELDGCDTFVELASAPILGVASPTDVLERAGLVSRTANSLGRGDGVSGLAPIRLRGVLARKPVLPPRLPERGGRLLNECWLGPATSGSEVSSEVGGIVVLATRREKAARGLA